MLATDAHLPRGPTGPGAPPAHLPTRLPGELWAKVLQATDPARAVRAQATGSLLAACPDLGPSLRPYMADHAREVAAFKAVAFAGPTPLSPAKKGGGPRLEAALVRQTSLDFSHLPARGSGTVHYAEAEAGDDNAHWTWARPGFVQVFSAAQRQAFASLLAPCSALVYLDLSYTRVTSLFAEPGQTEVFAYGYNGRKDRPEDDFYSAPTQRRFFASLLHLKTLLLRGPTVPFFFVSALPLAKMNLTCLDISHKDPADTQLGFAVEKSGTLVELVADGVKLGWDPASVGRAWSVLTALQVLSVRDPDRPASELATLQRSFAADLRPEVVVRWR